MTLHHITVEVDRQLIAEERLFWAVVGFGELGLQHRGRRSIHWLVSREHGCAIHLHTTNTPATGGLGHIALCLSDAERTARLLARFGYRVEAAEPYFGAYRRFTFSPSRVKVEIIDGIRSQGMGMPLEGVA